MFLKAVLLIFFTKICVAAENEEEPTCLSRWDYDFKTMKQLLKLETEQEEMKKLIQQQTTVIDNHRRELDSIRYTSMSVYLIACLCVCMFVYFCC